MTDTTSTPPPASQTPPPRHDHEAGLFRWARGLGIVRGDRWIAGVCGGLAARLGIDPLIVRGIFVVAALIGFPAVLVYAVCWLLLPDLQGRIPLQQLGRSPAGPFVITLGAIGLSVLSLLLLALSWRSGADVSWMFGGWWWQFFGLTGLGQFMTAVFWVALAVGAIVMLVRLSTGHRAAPSSVTTPFAPGSGDAPETDDAPMTSAAALDAGAVPHRPAAPPAEMAPPADLSPESVEQWRIQQDEWRRQYDEWRQQQNGADAAARDQARRERQEQGRAFAAAAQERAEQRRRTRPRTPGLYVVGTVGAALVGGAITALSVAHLGPMIASGAALLVAAIVCATGMTVAGILRRRSGFLAFVTSALLVIGLVVGALGVLVPDGATASFTTGREQTHRQAFGYTTIWVAAVHPNDDSGTFTLQKGYGGDTVITLPAGSAVSIDADLGDGTLVYETIPYDGGAVKYGEVKPSEYSASGTHYVWSRSSQGDAKQPAQTAHVRIEQQHGNVRVEILEDSK